MLCAADLSDDSGNSWKQVLPQYSVNITFCFSQKCLCLRQLLWEDYIYIKQVSGTGGTQLQINLLVVVVTRCVCVCGVSFRFSLFDSASGSCGSGFVRTWIILATMGSKADCTSPLVPDHTLLQSGSIGRIFFWDYLSKIVISVLVLTSVSMSLVSVMLNPCSTSLLQPELSYCRLFERLHTSHSSLAWTSSPVDPCVELLPHFISRVRHSWKL